MDDEKKTTQLSEEAFPENFPTSAKPVFRAILLLVGIIALLCFTVYQCSEHPVNESDTKDVTKKHIENKLDIDDEDQESEE